MTGKIAQELAVEIFYKIAEEMGSGPFVVTVAVTHNERPGVGKTSVGVAATWDITKRERKEVFGFILKSVDDDNP